MRAVESTMSVNRMVEIDPREASVMLRAVAPVRAGGQLRADAVRTGAGIPIKSGPGSNRLQLGKLSGPLRGKGFSVAETG